MRSRDEFSNRVEAARLGTLFAHDIRAYRGWRRRIDADVRKPTVSDEAVVAQIMALGALFPGNVERVTA